MIHIEGVNAYDAYRKVFTTVYKSPIVPSDNELLKEATVVIEIQHPENLPRIRVEHNTIGMSSFEYDTIIVQGNALAAEECRYWTDLLFRSNKVETLVQYLRRFPESKRAIMLMWEDSYADLNNSATPIVYAFFRIQHECVHTTVHMRANDVYRCILIDLDVLRAVHTYVSTELGYSCGSFTYIVDSAHLYKNYASEIDHAYHLISTAETMESLL